MRLPDLRAEDITVLESAIDKMQDSLPEMKNFILPGGHPTVSHIHIARCVCRRAERCCVRLEADAPNKDSLSIQYLNRLSDYLFVLARYAGAALHAEEIKWTARL